MPFMDRDHFIGLLNRLGDPDDAVALAAARTIHARVAESGFGWTDLLVPAPSDNSGEGADNALEEPAAPADPTPVPPSPSLSVEGDIIAVLEGLLSHPEISTDTRLDLQAMKDDAEAGHLDPRDERYARALAARLSGGGAG